MTSYSQFSAKQLKSHSNYIYYDKLNSCSSSEIKPINIINRESDAMFAEYFFSESNVKNKLNDLEPILMSNTQNDIFLLSNKCKEMKAIELYLRTNIKTLTNDEFNDKVNIIHQIKANITKEINLFHGKKFEALKQKLSKRIINRKRIKQHKNELKIQKENNKKLKINDNRLTNIKKNADQEKKEIERIEIDKKCIIINKHKSEAQKLVSLLEALSKLRKAREKSALGCGKTISSKNSKDFFSSIDKLLSLWTSILNKYVYEETRLKEILSSSKEAESFLETNDKISLNIENWKTALFGLDKLFFLKKFENNLEQFINIRKKWDQYICSDATGSRIPIFWVLPTLPPSEKWKMYLE